MSTSSSSSSAAAAGAEKAQKAAVLPDTTLTPASLDIKEVKAGDHFRCGPALTFQIDAIDPICTRARAATLNLPHGPVRTPVFMPVGTQGTIKGCSTLDLTVPPLDCEIILGNTYHLGNRPGGDTLEHFGGLHKFMGWDRNLLTDSGGFQMVSLLALAEISEEGVNFASPVDGSKMLLTPEMSMRLQNQIGADIMMALDDVVDSKTVNDERFKEACYRTLRWIDRCIAAHGRKHDQNLYGITQGGLDVSADGLRDICMRGMLEQQRFDNLPGYAIGGLAGGEDKVYFWRVVEHGTRHLPLSKPRYLMGVGYPLDIIVCSALGVDQYDCVYPTRTGRFGTAMVHSGLLKLKNGCFGEDTTPIDPTCSCYVCKHYTRAHIHLMLKAKESSSNVAQLVTYHNLAYMMRLIREMRQAIIKGKYSHYCKAFVHNMFPGGVSATGSASSAATLTIPPWVIDALKVAGVDVSTNTDDKEMLALFEGTPRANSVPSASSAPGASTRPINKREAAGAGAGFASAASSSSSSSSSSAAPTIALPSEGPAVVIVPMRKAAAGSSGSGALTATAAVESSAAGSTAAAAPAVVGLQLPLKRRTPDDDADDSNSNGNK
jgi:queuine tRNA-ribosyltransferase catalytic subunit